MTTLFDFAQKLHKWGANVTAIKTGTKRPLHKWQHWQHQRQTDDELGRLPWQTAAALGIVNGSGDFRVFDIDAPKDKNGRPLYSVPEEVLVTCLHVIGLPPDYQWSYASGSGAGWGFIVRCEEPLSSDAFGDVHNGVIRGRPLDGLKYDHLELRWSSGQTVIAGKHPTGPGYFWRREEPPFLPPAMTTAVQIANAFCAIATPPTKSTQATLLSNSTPTAASWRQKYGQGALASATQRVQTAVNGTRNNTLFRETAGMAELVNANALDTHNVKTAMLDAAMMVGLPSKEADATVESAFKHVGDKMRDLPQEELQIESSTKPDPEKLSTFADIHRLTGSIEWSWPGWMANGYLHLLASEAGVGKSFLAMRIAGCFLLGMPWPDGTPFTGGLGNVLWCEAEAAQQLNKERALALGLPLERIIIPSADPFRDIDLRNNEDKDAIWSVAYDDKVKFIVVDSLSGADPREENDSSKLTVLKWWAELARNTGKPMLITHHLNKPLFGNENVTLHRLRGSTAIPQLARVIWTIDTPDPNNRELKRLSVLKNNLAAFPEPIGVTIGDGVRFGAAPTAPQQYSELDRAMDFLRDLLAREPIPAKDVEEAAEAEGLSMSTVRRAKKQLGVTSVRTAENIWQWSLPVID